MPGLSGQQIFMAPVPLEAPLPEYPKKALVKDAAPVSLVVRIIIYEDGVVHEVLDSPSDQRAAADHREVFREAVEAAVRSWRFRPAIIRTMAEGEDLDHDGKVDYTVTAAEKPVRSYLDLRFTFEVERGGGRVQVGPSR
ncbi:MAG TPA: hypothetical protein VFT43_03410 [Candidatus Polarisedimenticolia bacterium]|nr:hypothetical protein [Candidatus Polarisedimenticolia bacterium]